MDYWFSLPIPADTAVTAPERKDVSLCPGTVKEVMIFFPKGHAGKTHVRILHNEAQVWPTNVEEWYLGDGIVIEWPENYAMGPGPFDVALEGYNDSASIAHTVYFRLTVLEAVRTLMPLPPVPVGSF